MSKKFKAKNIDLLIQSILDRPNNLSMDEIGKTVKYLKDYTDELKVSKGKLECIVAVDRNNGIGYHGQLLFRNSADMKSFKDYTTGKVLVMGGNTYRSLPTYPNQLPCRDLVVLTKEEFVNEPPERVTFCSNMEALNGTIADLLDEGKDVVICGGESLYREFALMYDELMVTTLDIEFLNVDSYFPGVNLDVYVKVNETKIHDEEHDCDLIWTLYKER